MGSEEPVGSCFSDLPEALRLSLFALLQPQELLNSAQCCREWRELACDELLWEALAKATWPSHLLDLSHYQTHKRLVLDRNRSNVTESLVLSTACTWRQSSAYNASFYQCKLLSLDLTGDTEFSLAFDARGELDIRTPITSTLAVVTLKPGAAAGPGEDNDGAQVPRGPEWRSSPFDAVHVALKPTSHMFCAGQRGHYKGILRWPRQELLAALDAPNRSLVFCYACDLGSSGVMSYQRGWPDYTTAVLLSVPAQRSFADVWRGKRVYRGKSEQEVSLVQETRESEEGRWADRPDWVADRADWWPVHRPMQCEWKEASWHELHAEGALEWMVGWDPEGSDSESEDGEPLF